MTLSDFENPRDLFKCSQSDCERDRAGNTPLCSFHLREQEVKSVGISEPELEASLVNVKTEDDDHPGMVKVYDRETGEPSWVPAEDNDPHLARPAPQVHVGPDPDTTWPDIDQERVEEVLRLDVPTWNQRVGVDPIPERSEAQTATQGCWVAHHPDWSSLALFHDELEALRYGVKHGMQVRTVSWGEELGRGSDQGRTHGA